MLDHITHLFRLQAIVEAGSMRRAAEVLNVTQPALTRSIAVLEERFGQPLLERHARGVRPTAFGLSVMRSTQRLARFWDIVDADLRNERRGMANTLRISAGPLWRVVVLPELLSQLQREMPELTIELRNSVPQDSRTQLLEGNLDVTFGGLQEPDEPADRLIKREFTVVQDRVVARDGHPLFDAVDASGQVDPGRLLDFGWLVYDIDPSYRATTLHATVERVGQPPNIRFICESLISAIRILQSSDCLCVLPNAALVETVNPRVLPVPVSLSRRQVRSGAIHRAEFADWPPIVRLMELCAAYFARTDFPIAHA